MTKVFEEQPRSIKKTNYHGSLPYIPTCGEEEEKILKLSLTTHNSCLAKSSRDKNLNISVNHGAICRQVQG